MERIQKASGRETESERIVYFDFLRIFAIAAVIVLHTAASNWETTDIHSFAWRTFTVYDSMVRWSVPVFTMISGALFLDGRRELSIKKLYTKYVLRIVIAFLFWSTVYASATCILEKGTIASLLAEIIQGHYHMWFMYMIVGLYMITPLLKRITANRKDTEYFLILSFIFTILVPTIMHWIQFADTLLGTGRTLYRFANNVYSQMEFHFAVGYSFYYVLGDYLSTTDFSKKAERRIYILGILGFVSTVLLTIWISNYRGRPTGTFLGNMSFGVMLESIAVFTFARYKAVGRFKTERQKRIVGKLSRYSFGMYLVHAGLIKALSKLGLTTLSFSPVLSVPVIVIIVFTLSLIVSAVLNRIPIINKYLV